MGASREMTVGLLVEPALMLVVFSVACGGGTTDLGELAARRATHAELAWHAPDLLALGARWSCFSPKQGEFRWTTPIPTSSSPCSTRACSLEHSGPGPGLHRARDSHQATRGDGSSSARCSSHSAWRAVLGPLSVAIALAAFLGKVAVLAIFLGVVESSYAKLRFFRVPQFLGDRVPVRLPRARLEGPVSPTLATSLIDDIGGLLLFTMILILASGQIYRAIYAVAAQSAFLAVAGAVLALATGNADLWVIAGITIVVKASLLPWLL